MYVFLDESGDTGFRLQRGSSRFFIVSMIVVDDPVPLETALQALRVKMRTPTYEFKFAHTADAGREEFFRAIYNQTFGAHCRVVDKQDILDRKAMLPEFQTREGMYGHFVRLALRDISDELVAATLVLDESSKSKREKARFTTALRRHLGGPPGSDMVVAAVRYRDSRRESLLQVADMVGGAVARSYEAGDHRYRRLLPGRKLDVRDVQP